MVSQERQGEESVHSEEETTDDLPTTKEESKEIDTQDLVNRPVNRRFESSRWISSW